MSLLGWVKRRKKEEARRQQQWRQSWAAAIDDENGTQVDLLRAELRSLQRDVDDVEIETEMMDALEQLLALRDECDAGCIPVVETQHRVIGAELCHFTAPASLPDDPSQSSGRVLFTPSRSVFVAAGRTSVVPWHAAPHVVRADRDVLLARADGAGGARYRFNSYADAAIATFLARRLKAARSTRPL